MTTKVNWKEPQKKLYFADLKINENFVFKNKQSILWRKVDVRGPSIHGILHEETGDVYSPSNTDLTSEVYRVEAVVNCEA